MEEGTEWSEALTCGPREKFCASESETIAGERRSTATGRLSRKGT